MEPTLTLITLDLAGCFVFALSGGLVAVRKELDIFGVVVLACVTGLGGGFLRDMAIGATPVAALSDWRYLVVPMCAGLLTFFFHPALGRLGPLINVFDALGLGLFVIAGALKALDYGLSPLAAAIMGLATGVGGGVIRDVLAGLVPVILRRSVFYAIPGFAGASVVAFGLYFELPPDAVMAAAFVICVGWRLLAMWRHWEAPLPRGSASV
ncbi:putative membrane protein YeiH [Nocardioides albertanoniae]|uniref:Putative membrane protein YeiH n=1 Tax=Nocardioides albertanoniae TaxID=1175486 RepID=A0A543A968_9ACTN|nr:trimeric intracellular cation channel family protein [Nocardioides albertanoniae]TQL69105.1 putative membrane protein YeiH [Nocardioides albertanoniae]